MHRTPSARSTRRTARNHSWPASVPLPSACAMAPATGVTRPVHCAEGPRAEAVAQQTGDDHDGEHVEGECPQAEPQRSIGAEERHDEVDEA